MFLECIVSILLGGIETFCDRNLYMETWYNSQILMNFTDFCCVTFLAQNVLIPTNYLLLQIFFIRKVLVWSC